MKLINMLTISTVMTLLLSSEAMAFREDFNTLNPSVWGVATWQSPGTTDVNSGRFVEDHVEVVNGYLRLKLTQNRVGDGKVESVGGEVYTFEQFGYGTYTFRMRASSTSPTPTGEGDVVSGAVSAAFVYADKATTEIDVEFESNHKDLTHVLTWQGENNPNEHSKKTIGGKSPHDKFYTYSFVWSPDLVEFYRDGELIEIHDAIVPTDVGKMVFNHWGTNSKWWGGTATLGQDRYIFVDWFTYEPIY